MRGELVRESEVVWGMFNCDVTWKAIASILQDRNKDILWDGWEGKGRSKVEDGVPDFQYWG